MAKAKQLPSGNWRVQVFIGRDENGKQKFLSFTAETKKEAEYMALEYDLKKKKADKPDNMTVGQAIDRYIESKDAVLSPTTIKGYKSVRRSLTQDLMSVKLNKVTNELIQKEINKESKNKSPKTIRNLHGLISSALKQYYPDMHLNTTLPRKEKHDVYMPTEDEIKSIVNEVKDTVMELPVLLSICLGLRRSEICGLTWSDINYKKKTVNISQAKVNNDDGEWVIKGTKSYAGYRVLTLPDVLVNSLQKQEHENEFVVTIAPGTITNKFIKLTSKLNIPHLRFHDLRHYNASIMLALGVPDKYAMERMGHTTNNMLKTVYQHTIDNEKEKINAAVDNHFDKLLN